MLESRQKYQYYQLRYNIRAYKFQERNFSIAQLTLFLPRALSLSLYPLSPFLLLVVPTMQMMEDPTTDNCRFFIEDTNMYNRIVLGTLLPQYLWVLLPRFFQTWLRNYIGGVLLYFISGFLWSFYVYHWKQNVYVPKGIFFIYIFFLIIFGYHLCFFITLLLKMLSFLSHISVCVFFFLIL